MGFQTFLGISLNIIMLTESDFNTENRKTDGKQTKGKIIENRRTQNQKDCGHPTERENVTEEAENEILGHSSNFFG